MRSLGRTANDLSAAELVHHEGHWTGAFSCHRAQLRPHQWVVGCPGAVVSHRGCTLPSNRTSNQQAMPCTGHAASARDAQRHSSSRCWPCQGPWIRVRGRGRG